MHVVPFVPIVPVELISLGLGTGLRDLRASPQFSSGSGSGHPDRPHLTAHLVQHKVLASFLHPY